MPLTTQALEDLLKAPESDIAERKEFWSGSAPDKSRQAICAFANDLPGHGREGVLFVGVRDDGTPTGLPITDQLLQTLADIKSDGKIVPPPSITVEKRVLFGVDVAVVHVRPSDTPPVRYDGRVWVRTGPRRSVATAQEERILSERRIAGDRPFDAKGCSGSTLSDLDLNFFTETYLPSAIDREILRENGRTQGEQLGSLKFVSPPLFDQPTNAAILALGRNPVDWLPGAYVQFLKFQGDELTSPIVDEATISGRLDEVIRRTEDKFRSHNAVAVDLTSEDLQQNTSSYPLVAFQQVFRNAVMHRTYEHTNAPIRVYWFSDRIEIHSPGGPFGAVTPENFGQPGITDYRNPNIAEAMKHLGYAQRFGVGISTAKKALAENGGQTLEFEVTSTFTMFRLRGKR